MIEKRASGGPGIGLLLLIPAAILLAKAAMHHHRMTWDDASDRGGPRLPPRAERMLDAWHARAHEAAGAPEVTPDAAPSA